MAINMAQPARQTLRPWLESVQESTAQLWREDLKSLFVNAKNRYPDVVWETRSEKGGKLVDEVWGHQAIIHARAPQAFQDLYLPRSAEGHPSESHEASSKFNSPRFRRLKNPQYFAHNFFMKKLRYFYTAESAFERGNIGFETCHDLLKDFTFMWKSRRFSDVRISLRSTNDLEEPNDLAMFHSHRFILSLRSPYFRDVIADKNGRNAAEPIETLIIHLPSPLFTPDSLHFILGYIYSGTLLKSPQHEYKLSTAFAIFRGSSYLALPALQELMLAEITVEMLHGLFHAPLPDTTCMKPLSGKWTKMADLGCRCWECARRAPLVLQFALGEDVKNGILERGARRALVGLFGEGWFTEELSSLPTGITDSIISNVRAIITPANVLPLLFAAENALLTHDASSKNWHSPVRAMIIAVRQSVEEVLCACPRDCFATEEWEDILKRPESDVQFRLEDGSDMQVGWVMQALLRGSNRGNWFAIYETLVTLTSSQTRSREYSLLRPNFRISAQIDRAKPKLLEAISSRLSLPTQKTGYSLLAQTSGTVQSDIINSANILAGGSPQISVVSLPSVGSSLDSAHEGPTDDPYNSALSTLDLANTISLYSSASSRTVSTDYGTYYTRRALSQEMIHDRDSEHSKRRSYDSFWAQALARTHGMIF